MKALKELKKLLEPYENQAEDFYYQLKKYYQEGITTSVDLPWSPSEVQSNPQLVVDYLSTYRLLKIESLKFDLNEKLSLLFELGPVLFLGDTIEVLILDKKVGTSIVINKVKINASNNKTYTIQVKLVKEGKLRLSLEKDFDTLSVANFFKKQLNYIASSGLIQLLETSDPVYEKQVWEISKKIALTHYELMLKDKNDLNKINKAKTSDLGFKDVYELYILFELLQDEPHWLLKDHVSLKKELSKIIAKKKAYRLEGSSIIID